MTTLSIAFKEANDTWESALPGTVFLPILSFEYQNLGELKELITGFRGRFSGLILTSPRAVDALVQVNVRGIDANSIPCWPVGPKTAKVASQVPYLLVQESQEAGSADQLANILTRHYTESSDQRPFLFICGEWRRETLPEILKSYSVPFQELIVYKTMAMGQQEFGEKWTGLTHGMTDLMRLNLLLFSPSGVETVFANIEKWHQNNQSVRITWIAIGKTTADSIREHLKQSSISSVSDVRQAAKPTPESFASLIETFRYTANVPSG